MSSYILSCCSTADLAKEHFERRDLRYICFHYRLDGVEYPDDLGQTVSFSDFYRRMTEGADTATSQLNVSEYLEYFCSLLAEGKDVLHLSLSSGISGSVNSARNAARLAAEQYPDRKIYVVDSLAASSGFGLLMDKLADLRDEGATLEEVRDFAETHKTQLHHWFFATDLKFFVKGGRISKAAGLFGGILGICPLLNVNNQGKLVPRSKIRGKKQVIHAMVEQMKEHAQDGLAYADKCYMSHSACYADARAVADLIEAQFPYLKGKVEINDIGTTIGSHSGPGTVAVFFWGDERTA